MRIYVERKVQRGPHAGRPTGEWLKGDTTKDEMAEEALALLSDPKDSILSVKIWDDRHGQFHPVTFAPGWSKDGTHKLCEGEVDL